MEQVWRTFYLIDSWKRDRRRPGQDEVFTGKFSDLFVSGDYMFEEFFVLLSVIW